MVLRTVFRSSAIAALALAPAVANAAVIVTLGGAGVQTPSQVPAFFIDFETAVPAGVTMTGVNVVAANQFGGAGGVGNYGSTSGTGVLSFTAAPTSYFGFWASALDGASGIEFFRGAQLVGGFNLRDAFAVAGGNAAYFGNPNANFRGQNAGEAYAYFNFTSDILFDRVNLYGSCCNGTGTIEADNIAIGLAAAVPEPATWAMMIAGFGLTGAAMRRRRKVTVHFA